MVASEIQPMNMPNNPDVACNIRAALRELELQVMGLKAARFDDWSAIRQKDEQLKKASERIANLESENADLKSTIGRCSTCSRRQFVEEEHQRSSAPVSSAYLTPPPNNHLQRSNPPDTPMPQPCRNRTTFLLNDTFSGMPDHPLHMPYRDIWESSPPNNQLQRSNRPDTPMPLPYNRPIQLFNDTFSNMPDHPLHMAFSPSTEPIGIFENVTVRPSRTDQYTASMVAARALSKSGRMTSSPKPGSNSELVDLDLSPIQY